MRGGLPIPKSVAQLTGVLVTAIVAFGTDIEVYYAVPLGVFAGALAMFFVSLSEAQSVYEERWKPPSKQAAYRDRWDRYK
jgi:hypothetical protein